MTRLLPVAVIAALSLVAIGPAFAAGPQAAIVLKYRAPDGREGPVVLTPLPVGSFGMGDCHAAYSTMVPTLKKQLAGNPEYEGFKYLSASCELYTQELLDRAGKFHG